MERAKLMAKYIAFQPLNPTQGHNLKRVEEPMSIISLRWSFLIDASFKWAFLKGYNRAIRGYILGRKPRKLLCLDLRVDLHTVDTRSFTNILTLKLPSHEGHCAQVNQLSRIVLTWSLWIHSWGDSISCQNRNQCL